MRDAQREDFSKWRHKEETGPEDEKEPVEELVDELLKQSPMVIFSKSYCPYSKSAKNLLLQQYSIQPPPEVVELDIHSRGSEIQEDLAKRTGRKTVPNIIILGKSVGGSEEVTRMDESGSLAKALESAGKGELSAKKVEAIA